MKPMRSDRSKSSRDESCVFLPTFGDGSDHREAAPGATFAAENIKRTLRILSCLADSTVTF